MTSPDLERAMSAAEAALASGDAAALGWQLALERITTLRAALEELVAVADRIHFGDPTLDPEEWYAIRDYAKKTLITPLPGSAETVARDDSVTAEAGTDSAHDLCDWVCATIDYLLLDEPRPATLGEYVSKPTLARKAKDKVEELARRATL